MLVMLTCLLRELQPGQIAGHPSVDDGYPDITAASIFDYSAPSGAVSVTGMLFSLTSGHHHSCLSLSALCVLKRSGRETCPLDWD